MPLLVSRRTYKQLPVPHERGRMAHAAPVVGRHGVKRVSSAGHTCLTCLGRRAGRDGGRGRRLRTTPRAAWATHGEHHLPAVAAFGPYTPYASTCWRFTCTTRRYQNYSAPLWTPAVKQTGHSARHLCHQPCRGAARARVRTLPHRRTGYRLRLRTAATPRCGRLVRAFTAFAVNPIGTGCAMVRPPFFRTCRTG